jgi:hypothetical protein
MISVAQNNEAEERDFSRAETLKLKTENVMISVGQNN